MVRKPRLRVLAAAALVLACLLPASARQKELKWEIVLGGDSTQAEASTLYLPLEVETDKQRNIYVLQSGSIEKFDKGGHHLLTITLKKGKGPAEFAGPASVALDADSSLYVWDRFQVRVSKLDASGKFINSFKVGSRFEKMAYWGKGNLLFLGLSEGNILHIYSNDGSKLKSFGSPFDPIPDVPAFATSPREWWVRGDTIWVANPLEYEIRKYVGEKLVSTIKGPDKLPPPLVRSRDGSIGVAISKGVFGVAAVGGLLVATVMQPSNVASLDVFNTTSGDLLDRIECLPRLRSSDQSGRLYFVDEDKVRIGRVR